MTSSFILSVTVRNNFDLLINKSQRDELKDQYSSTYQVNHNDIKDSHLEDTINNSNGNENIYDEMTKDILSQIPGSDHLKGKDIEDLTERDMNNLISPQRWKQLEKLENFEDD